MAQPVWQTPAGSLGVVPESIFFRYPLLATDPDLGTVTYSLIAGTLPSGIQVTTSGDIVGVPTAVTTVQGVPTPVNRDVTSKFVVRANSSGRIADRTFTLTITGNDPPTWTTPAGSIGSYYDGDLIDFQFVYADNDPDDVIEVSLIAGILPGGLTISSTGLLYGYIEPATPFDQTPGYDETPAGEEPYDFLTQFQSRNYQFTLEVSDGKSQDIRTFSIFVWARNELTGDTTQITADVDTIDASQTNIRAPFLLNASPSNLGTVRSDNYYAYEFLGDDYDTENISYAISVNQGFGLPPGLTLDPNTGWLYGTIPDQGTTEIEYSFNINVYQTDPVSTVECTNTSASTNRITCVSTANIVSEDEWYNAVTNPNPLRVPIRFDGTALGGLSTAGETIYWVRRVYDLTTFDITSTPTGTDALLLTTSSGSMTGSLIITSDAYPFSLTITGDIDSEVTWITDSDLGTIVNGETSLLKVEAVNRGGRTLEYKLASGEFNSLPQGLQLLPSGDIAGRVTFNTFAIDLGATTIDNNTTTWDSNFSFVVNAFAPDTSQTLYSVGEVLITNGGSGYSRTSPPTILFSTPIGASAVQAVAGNVTIGTDSVISTVSRDGFLNIATITTTEPHLLTTGDDVTVQDCSVAGFDTVLSTITVTSTVSFTYTNVGATVGETVATGNVLSGSDITSVTISNPGAGYTGTTPSTGGATITITEGFGGSGAELEADMLATDTRDVVSTFRTFTLQVVREYNAPYQNLYVQAMPPESDRLLIDSLLNNTEIFDPDFIFRPTDPFFGKSTKVTYQHAFGLAPDALETYVDSLYLNHYWKNLVLGSVETAVARDDAGNIIYEVVYSRVVDNLVNNEGESVGKIVTLPYAVTDAEIRSVYPNSLDNMRNQVIDTVGQISTSLPLWMTSKQADGRVLGFTPAWVIAYVNPGRSNQIAYYLQQQFGEQLNKVDFKVDRYVLDRSLSIHWDTETQDWTPQPNLTTFDRFDTANYDFIGNVTVATQLAYSDVNARTVTYITDLGGLDGNISIQDGDTLIFVKQEDYDGPPGSSYSTTDAAWQEAEVIFDGGGYDATGTTFDEGYTVNGGLVLDCTDTTSGTNVITYVNSGDSHKVYAGLPMTFQSVLSGSGLIEDSLYVVLTTPSILTFTVAKASYVTTTASTTDLITVSDITGFTVGDAIDFYQTTFGGIVEGTTYYILSINSIGGTAANITVSLTSGGVRETFSTASGSCIMKKSTAVALTSASGSMDGLCYNERMAIYQINLDSVTQLVTLTVIEQTEYTPIADPIPYVQVSQGRTWGSAQLYRPSSPGVDLTRISWLPLTTITTDETIFDQGSVAWIEPVDMYNPGDTNDKYLVFPKSNILV